MYYQARLLWGVTLWLAPLVALLIPAFTFLPEGSAAYRAYWALRTGETFVPLLGPVICANLFAREWELGVAELWLSRSISRPGLLLSRLAVALGVMTALMALPLLVLRITYAPFAWREMWFVVWPPAAFLGLLAMAVGILTKQSTVAFLIPLVYWFFEMTTKGAHTGAGFLFARTMHGCSDSIEDCLTWMASLPWIRSKLLLLAATLGLASISAWVLQRSGRGWRR